MIVRELWARLGIQVDQGSVTKADNTIKSLKSSLSGLAAGYGFFQAFRAVRDAIQETADAARRLSLESKRTGLDPQFLQELEYGAKRTGVSTEALQHGLAHLARSAYEASNGSGEAGATFQKLGVQVKGADGKVRPIRELLGDVADKFSGIQNAAEANAVSMQLMGRAGAELIPFFQLGSEGIAKMGAAARKTGGIMSDYLVRQGERTADAIDDVQMSVRGLTYAILGPLLPAITKGKNELAKWIQEHRKLIALRAHDVFNLLTRAMKGVVAVAQEIPKTLALVGVGLLAWASPITAIAGAFALLAEDLYTYFGEHNPYSITFLVIGFFKLLKKRFDDIWKDFRENPFGFLVQKAKEAFDGIVAEAKKMPGRLKGALEAVEPAAVKPTVANEKTRDPIIVR